MFNSLPKKLKDKIRSEYHLRFSIVVFVSVFILQVIFLLSLVPSWILSVEKEREIASRAEKVNESSLNSQIDFIDSTTKSINARLEIINSVLEYPKVTPLFDGILSKKTGSIRIRELIYTFPNEKTANIVVSGTGATREALVSFAKRLEDSNLFEKVNLPISNFTRDKNIDFSINISVAL